MDDYTRYLLNETGRRFEHAYNQQRAYEIVETAEARARGVHNGRDGLPSYDDVFEERVKPMIEKDRRIFDWLMQQPDAAEASYLFGCALRYPHLADVLQSQGPEVFFEYIRRGSGAPAPSVRARGGRHKPGTLSKAQIEAMSPADFELELQAFKNSHGER